MSLRKAVEEVVKEMVADAERLGGGEASCLRYFVRLLNMALKMSEGEEAPRAAALSHRDLIEQAKEEFRARKLREDSHIEEQVTPRSARLGDSDPPQFIDIPGDTPAGARTMVGDVVYELHADGVLRPVTK